MTDNITPSTQNAQQPTETVSASGMGPNQMRTVRVYTHSPILYWWPIWFLGLLFFFSTAILNWGGGDEVGNFDRLQGQIFVYVLLFVIFSTTVRLRGANSVIFGLVLAIGAILLAVAGLNDNIGKYLSGLNIHMSSSFYLFLGITIFAMWAAMVFGFDKVKYYEIAPGQIRQKVFWGSGDTAESGANARSRYQKDDFLRHRMLGLALTGDIDITLHNGDVWHLHNVLFAKRKSEQINNLIVTRPID